MSGATAGARPVLALGVALLLAGLALASPTLLVPGLALLLLPPAIGIWVRLAARGAGVERAALPPRVVEGEPVDIELTVRSGLLPLAATLLEPTIERPLAIRSVLPRRHFRLRRVGTLGRRGRHELPAPLLRIADPYGLRAREVSGVELRSVLVLPRVEPILGPGGGPGPAPGVLRRGTGELAGGGVHESPADPELEGLRPYRAGTPASRIYWPALARGGELIERRLAAAASAGPLIALDASGPASEEVLDRAVRAAASLCFHLARAGGCELLLPAERGRLRVEPGPAWMEAHAALALVERGHGAPRIRELPRDAPLFWVSAGASERLPPGARGYLIAPDALRGRSVAFTVAGCAAYRLEPAGLGRARRRAAA